MGIFGWKLIVFLGKKVLMRLGFFLGKVSWMGLLGDGCGDGDKGFFADEMLRGKFVQE